MTLTTPMKVVLAVIIIAIIGLGFWMLDWQTKWQQEAQLKKSRQEKLADKERFEKDLQQVDDLIRKNSELKKQLDSIVIISMGSEKPEEFVPNYLARVETLVAQVATENNDRSFEIVSLTPGKPQQSGASVKPGEKGASPAPAAAALAGQTTRQFQMSMKGKYETVIDFLDRLGKLEMERLVTVDKLSLAPAGGTPAEPILAIALPLTAYMNTGGGGKQ